jgi:hypothetical protein
LEKPVSVECIEATEDNNVVPPPAIVKVLKLSDVVAQREERQER